MKEGAFTNSPAVCIEIRQNVLEVLKGAEGLELPLERDPGGELTTACRENITRRLQAFLKKEVWQPRMRAYCAIGARGVSLRRLNLPPTTKENFPRLLALQIENEFPLPPEALAWGYRPLRNGEISGAQHGANQELLVVAVKKEVVEEYSEILSECGASPVFTVAALARRQVCHRPLPASALLDIGRDYAELVAFENNVPIAVRVLPFGESSLAQSGALDSLAAAVNGACAGQKLFVSGRGADLKGWAEGLERRLKGGAQCEAMEVSVGEGRSAATLGLQSATANGSDFPLLTLQAKPSNGNVTLARRVPWKWVAAAAALLLALVALPYAQAILFKGRLARRLAAIEAQRGRLNAIDHELDFLRYLKQNQPPYLDALFLVAKAAPQGTRFDSLTMNRHGDIAMRGSMHDSQQVVGFRSQLIDSGFFSSVAVEEQTPTPDRQKVLVRITAQWKPATDRQFLSIGPTAEDIEKAKNRPKDPPAGAFPMMGGGFIGGPPMPGTPSARGGMPTGQGKRMSVPGKTMATPLPPGVPNP